MARCSWITSLLLARMYLTRLLDPRSLSSSSTPVFKVMQLFSACFTILRHLSESMLVDMVRPPNWKRCWNAHSNPILPADRTRRCTAAWKHCAVRHEEPNERCPSQHATDTVWHSGELRSLAASGQPLQCPLRRNGHHRHGHARGCDAGAR